MSKPKLNYQYNKSVPNSISQVAAKKEKIITKPVSLRLPTELLIDVRELAKRENSNASVIIKRAIAEYVIREKYSE